MSVEQIPISAYPTVHVPEERLYLLQEHADRIADSWNGHRERTRKGLLGEDASAQHLGVSERVDVDVYPDGGDGGFDLRYRGATIDVKTVGRHRSDPALTVDAYEPLTADYYVLASRIGNSDVRLIGYAPRAFVANAQIRYSQGKPYHFVDQSYLFPIPPTIATDD